MAQLIITDRRTDLSFSLSNPFEGSARKINISVTTKPEWRDLCQAAHDGFNSQKQHCSQESRYCKYSILQAQQLHLKSFSQYGLYVLQWPILSAFRVEEQQFRSGKNKKICSSFLIVLLMYSCSCLKFRMVVEYY